MSVLLLKAPLSAVLVVARVAVLVQGSYGQQPSPALRQADADYRAGVSALSGNDLNTALADFEKVVSLRKQDQASARMIERCKQQLEAPTADGWDDTTVALTK